MTPLLLSRRFLPLFCCQFFAAFNDNFLKTALVFLILFGRSSNAEALITAASAVFIGPYFFLSALGGELADRHDKARVAQWIKFAEIFIAAIAAVGYALGSVAVVFAALFVFGILGALFGPIKYGILPDHLPRQRLPAANALIEAATFIAILTGTIAGGLASRGHDAVLVTPLLVAVALACWLSALFIPPTAASAPAVRVQANIITATAAMIHHLRGDSRLWWAAMVTSWFWLVGIVVLSLLPPLIKARIGGDEMTVTAYLALFSVAVGIGSWLAARVARGRIVLTTTFVGALLMAAFSLDVALATLGAMPPGAALQGPGNVFHSALGLRVGVDFIGLAIGGGLFIVPVSAAVQTWSDVAYRARTIAAVNVLNAAFMTGATVLVASLQKLGATVPQLFLALGIATLLVAVAIWRTRPKVT